MEEENVNIWKNVDALRQELHGKKMECLSEIPEPQFEENKEFQEKIRQYIQISLKHKKLEKSTDYFESRFLSSIQEKFDVSTEESLKKLATDYGLNPYASN